MGGFYVFFEASFDPWSSHFCSVILSRCYFTVGILFSSLQLVAEWWPGLQTYNRFVRPGDIRSAADSRPEFGRRASVPSLETFFRDALEPCRTIDNIADVRVKGAIGVVQMRQSRHLGWLRQLFIEEGVWVRPFGDIVYLMPPFIVTNQQRAALSDAVVTVMKEWSKKTG